MPDGSGPIIIKIVSKIDEIDCVDWDACARINTPEGNPTVSHALLHALEESRSVHRDSGWQPQHLVVEDSNGLIVGVVPMYLKNHSMGEYIFDYGWADAYERAGRQYYPKLQVSVPFTPVTGPRLLVRPGQNVDTIRSTLVAGMIEWTNRNHLSSLHITFPTEEDVEYLKERDFLIRHNHQYHWFNQDYETFDEFLGSLNSRKRKMIRRERRKVSERGITMACLTGDSLTSEIWDTFYRFYTDTYDRKWGYPYLTREFFEIISHTMPDQVMLVIATISGNPVAGALNIKGANSLFGRNWGCLQDYKFLHFETCYYCAIEYAINHRLNRVEAGTQGPHKLQRGYIPVQTRSAHWIPDPAFRNAVSNFLTIERNEEAREMSHLKEETPYRKH